MKENVLDVLMYLFENYFYDEPDDTPDRDSMEESLHQAGFSNGEINKAFDWLDGLAEQRYQPEFTMRTRSMPGMMSQMRRARSISSSVGVPKLRPDCAWSTTALRTRG